MSPRSASSGRGTSAPRRSTTSRGCVAYFAAELRPTIARDRVLAGAELHDVAAPCRSARGPRSGIEQHGIALPAGRSAAAPCGQARTVSASITRAAPPAPAGLDVGRVDAVEQVPEDLGLADERAPRTAPAARASSACATTKSTRLLGVLRARAARATRKYASISGLTQG